MIPEYRAWHKLQNRMLPVMCIDFAGNDISKGYPCIVAYPDDGCYNLKNVELLLYSTYEDLKRNKVCESDIILQIETGYHYLICFNGIQFYGRFIGGYDGIICLSEIGQMVVIGNKYQNPELLEASE